MLHQAERVDYKTAVDSSFQIADYLARTRFEDLSAAAVASAKASILDTIGCILAGTGSADVQRLQVMAAQDGGVAQSSVIGGGGLKLPAASAVLVNASAVHQDDFDDCHDTAPSHPTSASLPVALAVAEMVGGRSGKDLILAVALGNDLTCRLTKSIIGRVFDYPWFRPPVVGIFGATAAAASLMGADAERHRHALGLALPMAGGTWASLYEPGSSVRSIRDGLTYRNGVFAARMAMDGMRGDQKVFDGQYGFFQSFFLGEYRPEQVVARLGEFNETEHVSLKPWASNRLLHKMITAVVELMESEDLHFEDIASVQMEVGFINKTRCYPVHKGVIPDHRIDLLSNLPFSIAATIRHRGIPLALYHDGEMADDVIDVALPKVSWVESARQTNKDTYLETGRAKVTTATGKVFETACEHARGNHLNPMTDAQRHKKFRDCIEFAAKPVAESRAASLIQTVEGLEGVADIGVLIQLLQ